MYNPYYAYKIVALHFKVMYGLNNVFSEEFLMSPQLLSFFHIWIKFGNIIIKNKKWSKEIVEKEQSIWKRTYKKVVF